MENPEFKPESVAKETEDSPEKRAAFRVAIFGTGENKSEHDSKAVALAGGLAKEIVKNGGHGLVTGGSDSGIMGEVSRAGYEQAKLDRRDDLIPEGITLSGIEKLVKPSKEAKITEVNTLAERLHYLIDKSNAVVILYGGTGTAVELVTTLWSFAVEKLKNPESVPKPIIIADSSLKHADLLSQLNKQDADKFKLALPSVYIMDTGRLESEEGAGTLVADINSLIEAYYKKSLGKSVSGRDAELMEKFSLKNFLEAKESFENGAGI